MLANLLCVISQGEEVASQRRSQFEDLILSSQSTKYTKNHHFLSNIPKALEEITLEAETRMIGSECLQ